MHKLWDTASIVESHFTIGKMKKSDQLTFEKPYTFQVLISTLKFINSIWNSQVTCIKEKNMKPMIQKHINLIL